jgi:hypothetical protein
MPTDPKWRVIARASGQRIGDVIAVFSLLMVEASKADQRGDVSRFRSEDAAAALDLSEADVDAIKAAMEGRCVLNGRLNGWDKRQPKREDDSTARVAEHRARTKSAENSQFNDVTQGNAPEQIQRREDTDKKKSEATPQPDKLPVAEALSAWNDAAAAVGWPVVQRASDPRRTAMRARLREEGFDGWKAAIVRARASPYLGGTDPPSWFTFDWLVKPTNLLKVIEGNYDRSRQNGSPAHFDRPAEPSLPRVRAILARQARAGD